MYKNNPISMKKKRKISSRSVQKSKKKRIDSLSSFVMVCIIPVGILQLVQSVLAHSVDYQGQHKGSGDDTEHEIQESCWKFAHVSFGFKLRQM